MLKMHDTMYLGVSCGQPCARQKDRSQECNIVWKKAHRIIESIKLNIRRITRQVNKVFLDHEIGLTSIFKDLKLRWLGAGDRISVPIRI